MKPTEFQEGIGFFVRVYISCFIIRNRRVTLAKYPVTSHEQGQETANMTATSEHVGGHLRKRHSVSVDQVMMTTLNLSK